MKKKHGLMTKELKKKLRKSRNDNEILATLAAASNELDDDDLFLVTGGGAQYQTIEEAANAISNSDLVQQTQDSVLTVLNGAGSAVKEDTGVSSGVDVAGIRKEVSNNTDVSSGVDEAGITERLVNTDLNNNITFLTQDDQSSAKTLDDQSSVKVLGDLSSIDTGNYGDTSPFTGDNDNNFEMDTSLAEVTVDPGDGYDADLLKNLQNITKFN